MSKIGQKNIAVPSTVQISIDGKKVGIKGQKGEMSFELPNTISISTVSEGLKVERADNTKRSKSFHGLWRSILANAVHGVENHWIRKLEIVGTGFNVKMQGTDLALKVGYSHLVVYKSIPGITLSVDGNTSILVSGCDKQLVGQVAFQIKSIRKPDAYKGKGIKFEGEVVRIKPGKKAKTA